MLASVISVHDELIGGPKLLVLLLVGIRGGKTKVTPRGKIANIQQQKDILSQRLRRIRKVSRWSRI